MGNRRRPKRNKRRGMYKRMLSGKRPMSPEQKKIQRVKREAQREESNSASKKQLKSL